MKVKMLTLAAGPDFVLQPGKVYNLPKDVAQRFVAGKFAEPSDGAALRVTKPDPEEHKAIDADDDDEDGGDVDAGE